MFTVTGESSLGRRPHTHFKAAVYHSDEGAGDIKAPLDLSDAALHVGATKSFGEEYERKGDQKKLQRHVEYLLGEPLWDDNIRTGQGLDLPVEETEKTE